jgi:hypothetical protein
MREPRAYSIEEEVFSGRFAKLRRIPEGMTIADQRDIVATIMKAMPDRMMSMPVVERRRGRLSIDSWARPRDHRIVMGALAGPSMVCHEVAHLLAPPRDSAEAWHSRRWEIAYVECVRIVLGEYQAKRLAKAFEVHRNGPPVEGLKSLLRIH